MSKNVFFAVLCAVILGSCSDDGGGGNNGNEEDTDTEDEIGMSDVCVQLLECAELVGSDYLPQWQEAFGEDSVCWDDTDSFLMCEDNCLDNLNGLVDISWDYPWPCEAGAPQNTNDIETFNGVTWVWTMVGDDACLAQGFDEWTMFTTMEGADDWTFTADRWSEHPVNDPTAHVLLECTLATMAEDTYYDFRCDQGEHLEELVGTFSNDWSSATAIWDVVDNDTQYFCELEGVPEE